MKKIFILSVLFSLPFINSAQEVLLETDIELKSFLTDKRESYYAYNEKAHELALFLFDKNGIQAQLLNENYKIVDTLSTARQADKFNTFIGHSIDSSGYHLFFRNEWKNEFMCKSIHFEKDFSGDKVYEFKLSDEKLLESVNYKNGFYILTLKKQSSLLNIYIFEGNHFLKKQQIDLTPYAFTKKRDTSLYEVLNKMSGAFQSELKIQKIITGYPNPLSTASSESKLYTYDDHLWITLDNDIFKTKLIKINLIDFSHSVKFYKQSKILCDEYSTIKSNSFLHNDILYQVKVCEDEIRFTAYNLNADSLVKNVMTKKDDEISFKNTPLKQKGGVTIYTSGTDKDLKKTSLALKRITSGDVGISVHPLKDTLKITIGGYKEISGGGGGFGMAGSPGGTISTPHGNVTIPSTMHRTPTYLAGESEFSRTVYFKSLFSRSGFEHLPGAVSENAIEKIYKYSVKNSFIINDEVVFKIDDHYILAYYNKDEKKYFLRKFID